MRSILLGATLFGLASTPALADLEFAVLTAMAEIEAAQPTAMFAGQTLEQLDGCTMAIAMREAPGGSPDYATALVTLSADFATLDFANVQRAPVPLGDFEGVMLLIGTVGMEPIVAETTAVTEATETMQTAMVDIGGTCDGGTCDATTDGPFFRVAVMTEDAQTDTDKILTALSAVGAECGAAGL